MSTLDNLIANSDKVAYTSYFPTDKVVVANSETVNTHGYDTGAELLPIAIYTLDGGVTWQDGATTSTFAGFTLTATSYDCSSWYAVNNFFSFGTSLQVKYVGLAISGNDYTHTYPLSGTTALNTTSSYMKVALEGTFSKASGIGLTTTTIAHNLGYVPFANVWIKDSLIHTPAAWRRPFNNASTANISEGVRVDATNIYISTNNASDTTVYYRIYYDN